jgi:hypothetical protein
MFSASRVVSICDKDEQRAVGYYERSEPLYQTSRRHIPQNLHSHHCEYFKSHMQYKPDSISVHLEYSGLDSLK